MSFCKRGEPEGQSLGHDHRVSGQHRLTCSPHSRSQVTLGSGTQAVQVRTVYIRINILMENNMKPANIYIY